jgi:predicted negative regulator of RcsB-dependent stress response
VEDLSEKEQLEALRAWWAENGSYVIGGIIVGIVVIFGWNRWQSGIAETQIAASSIYEELMEASSRGDLDAAAAAAEQLFGAYPTTPYAGQARLAMAKLYMDNGRDQDAADVLRVLADTDRDRELAMVARLRLAKILLYQDKARAAVDLLAGQPESAFSARFNEVLGDAYMDLGEIAAAEAAYLAALNDNPLARTVDVSLIQLKLNDLPALDEAAEEAAESSAEPGTDTDETPAAEMPETTTPGTPATEDAADAATEGGETEQ